MIKTINKGRIFGIPLTIHWSFSALLVGLSVYGYFEGGIWNLFESLTFWSTLFASVLLHELGHAGAAALFGIKTSKISLNFMGGAAHFERQFSKPVERFVITLAGPLVNLVIAISGFALFVFEFVEPQTSVSLSLEGFVTTVVAVNAILFVFNMLPIYPLDGGQILRALIGSILKSEWEKRGTVVFTAIGASALAVYGLYEGSWIFVGLAIFLMVATSFEMGGAKKMQRGINSLQTKEALKELSAISSRGFDRDLVAVSAVPGSVGGKFVVLDKDGLLYSKSDHWAISEGTDDRIIQMKVILNNIESAKLIGGRFQWMSDHEIESLESGKTVSAEL